MSSNYSPSMSPKASRPSIIKHLRYSSHSQLLDLQYQTKIFSSAHADQYFNLLKRLHLSIPNTPQLRQKKQYNSSIQIEFKIYNKIWISHLMDLAFEQKIRSIILILKAYLQLIKEYGLFEIGVNHIKISIYKEQSIWINHNFYQNYCSHPLTNNIDNQQKLADSFISLVQGSFQNNLFKYKKIHHLADVLEHLEFISKRNMIHKKCNFLAQQQQRRKQRQTIDVVGSPHQKTDGKMNNFFYLSQGHVSTLMASNIVKYDREDYPKKLTKSNHAGHFKSSRMLKGKHSQLATTHFETQPHRIIKNKSELDISNLFSNKRTTKLSTHTFNQIVPNKQKYAKRSQFIQREDAFNKVLDNADDNRRVSCGFQRQTNMRDDDEYMLERDINNLLLSQIHEDEENDMKPLLQEFHNILD